MTDLKVVTLSKSNFRDPAATLRVIADQIESGEISDVATVGMVIMGKGGLRIYGIGPKSDPPDLCLLMQAAIFRFANEVEDDVDE